MVTALRSWATVETPGFDFRRSAPIGHVFSAHGVREPESFRDYVDKVTRGRFIWHQHNVKVANVLQRVADDELKRVMLFEPPRHGKSEQVSRLFSAYYLKRHPDRWVGVNSYAAELAYTLSRAARENFTTGGGELKEDAWAVKHWETAQGGGLWAAGVGGPITGKGFNLGVIDDPLKNADDAASETIREKQKEWYRSTFYTREEPGGAIILVMCMTGDTPVLMEDGTEKPLRNIRPGDRVATYDEGKVAASTVRNWMNTGPDLVYEIRMKSGIVVKANARHPFLVEEGGETKWRRTSELRRGDTILRVTGGNGSVLPALRRGATSQPSARACACHTTTRSGGQTACGRPRSILAQGAKLVCGTATELASLSTSACLLSRAACAPSARSRPQNRIPAPTGATSCASITATTAKRFGGFSATTATLLLAMARLRRFFSRPQSTYGISGDTVVEVVEHGVEDVFDVEIERTENFIANGLVSHNTRWHEDDLAGWLLSEEAEDEEPERWHIVHFDAVKDPEPVRYPETCTVEDDFRDEGEALCPERYSLEKLRKIAKRIGAYFWAALFQGRPRPKEGGLFKWDAFKLCDAVPAQGERVRYWDTAGTEGGGDYSVGALLLKTPEGVFYVLDVKRGQWSPNRKEEEIVDAARDDAAKYDRRGFTVWMEHEAGIGGKERTQAVVRKLAGYKVEVEHVTGSKEARAEPFASQVEAGNVYLPRDAPWLNAFRKELCDFPHAKHDDQVDAASGAFNKLALGALPAQTTRLKLY